MIERARVREKKKSVSGEILGVGRCTGIHWLRYEMPDGAPSLPHTPRGTGTTVGNSVDGGALALCAGSQSRQRQKKTGNGGYQPIRHRPSGHAAKKRAAALGFTCIHVCPHPRTIRRLCSLTPCVVSLVHVRPASPSSGQRHYSLCRFCLQFVRRCPCCIWLL